MTHHHAHAGIQGATGTFTCCEGRPEELTVHWLAGDPAHATKNLNHARPGDALDVIAAHVTDGATDPDTRALIANAVKTGETHVLEGTRVLATGLPNLTFTAPDSQ